MCDKAVDDNPDALEFAPDQCKTQQTGDKAVDYYSIGLEFVPDQCETHEMCDRLFPKILLC